ncbi:UBX domain-containing protein 4 [Tetranychus urticae]|uniref:UBX domain-containing protein 4 n=1 Tax=Tetranychus urticae TaxID=32264 RepID=T1K4A0_TETUR|nr:UBX domain-containing protein 4 [Tetranychus urticae]
MWFSGSVAEAVDKSKKEKKLFLVFIEGKDDVSKKMSDLLTNLRDEILSVMQREVVAIKVEEGSENCKLFGQIYPILMVPSIYCISNTGVNLEVIPGFLTEQEFMDKLDKVLIVHKANLTQPIQQSVPVTNPVTPVQPVLASVSTAPALSTTTSVPTSSSGDKKEVASDNNEQPAFDEKIAKAQQLLEQIKMKKAKEEEEKTKQQELDRIRSGKELAKAKARREELEMAELVKEREKEKREAIEARKRILAQIEADKEERRRRNELFKVPSCQKSEPKSGNSGTSSSKSNENESRIQFRFPDGSFTNQTFGADDPLCALRQFVIDTSPYRNFTLSTSYPKRVFTSDDLTRSLRDLELTPSSVLLVISSPSVVSKATSIVSTNIFLQIWPYIMTPFFWIWTFITSLFRTPPSPAQSASSPSSSGSQAGSSVRKRVDEEREQRLLKRQKESKLLNRDGNVARLRDNHDDKDDDGTWNGNSTQQM